MTSSESLRGVRPEGREASASDGARRPRADRIEIDFSWSDQDDFGWSEPRSRRTRNSSRREEPHPGGRAAATAPEPVAAVMPGPAAPSERRALSEPATPSERHAVPETAAVSEPTVLPAPTVEDVVAHATTIVPRPQIDPAPEPAKAVEARAATGTPERRTVVIRGQGARGYAPSRRGYEARLRPHERSGFKPDRVALWAVLLGLALLLGAVTSSHAAVLHHATFLHHTVASHAASHGTLLHHLVLPRAIHPAP